MSSPSPTKKQKCVETTTDTVSQEELYTELLTELVAKLPEHARVLRVNTPLFGVGDGSFGFGREVLDILKDCPSYKQAACYSSPLTENEISYLWHIVFQYKQDIEQYQEDQEKASADIARDLGILEEEKEPVEGNIFGDLEHSVTYIEDCPEGVLQGILERATIQRHPFTTLPEIWVKMFKLFEMVFMSTTPSKSKLRSPGVSEHEIDMVMFAMLQEIYPEFLHPDLKGGDDDSEPTQTFILLLEQATTEN